MVSLVCPRSFAIAIFANYGNCLTLVLSVCEVLIFALVENIVVAPEDAGLLLDVAKLSVSNDLIVRDQFLLAVISGTLDLKFIENLFEEIQWLFLLKYFFTGLYRALRI